MRGRRTVVRDIALRRGDVFFIPIRSRPSMGIISTTSIWPKPRRRGGSKPVDASMPAMRPQGTRHRRACGRLVRPIATKGSEWDAVE